MTRMGMLFIFEALHNKCKKACGKNVLKIIFLAYMGNSVSSIPVSITNKLLFFIVVSIWSQKKL